MTHETETMLLVALQDLVTALASSDDEGLIEHAPQMEAARTAIDHAILALAAARGGQ